MTQSPPSDTAPLVTVLLVTYNSVDDLESCLPALQRQKVPGGYEVVVVDNASADDSARVAEKWASDVAPDIPVTVVRNADNVGYAAANNQAADLARGRVLALLNPDAVMAEDCLQALVDHLAHNVGVGVAAAVLTNADGSIQEFARRDLSLGAVTWDLTELGRRIDRRFRDSRGHRHRRYSDEMADALDRPLAVDCPAAACIAVWRELTGRRLFDERLPLFFNDAGLFARIRERGYRCEITPAARARHGYGTSHRRIDVSRKRAEFVAAMRRYAEQRRSIRWCTAMYAVLLLDAVFCLSLGLVGRKASLVRQARGTLGGLGLPGGAQPWLTRQPGARARLRLIRNRFARALRTGVRNAGRRHRRRTLIRHLRWQGWLHRARVDVSIARDAVIDGRVRVELHDGRPAQLIIDSRAIVHDGVLLRMWGGTLHIHETAQVRHDAVLTVKGMLDIGAHSIISRGVQLHADGLMRIGFGAALAERVTVVDTTHAFDDIPTNIFDKPVEQADVTIEDFAFVGSTAVVSPGVTIGRSAVVAALSAVSRDVPPYTLVAGAPARVLRSVDGLLDRNTLAGAPAATE